MCNENNIVSYEIKSMTVTVCIQQRNGRKLIG